MVTCVPYECDTFRSTHTLKSNSVHTMKYARVKKKVNTTYRSRMMKFRKFTNFTKMHTIP